VGVTRSTRAAWRRPTVFTTIAAHSDCPCDRTALLGESSVKVETPDYTFIHSSRAGWGRETVRFSIESIIELLTFRSAIDNSREDYIRDFYKAEKPLWTKPLRLKDVALGE
jgi:hypothetical protein